MSLHNRVFMVFFAAKAGGSVFEVHTLSHSHTLMPALLGVAPSGALVLELHSDARVAV